MKRIIVIALLLAGCATAPADGTGTVNLTKEDVDNCNGQGGCILITKEKLFRLMERAYAAGVEWAKTRGGGAL